MDIIFNGLFDGAQTSEVGAVQFMICFGTSILLGFLLAAAYAWKNGHTKSFVTTLALLPAVVSVVIMMVNGNIGAGVAVAGAFSLVRFRSAPGSAKEIVAIFLAMGTGLIAGMGYIAYAVLFTLIMSGLFIFCNHALGGGSDLKRDKTVKITIPEDLDYTGVFDGIFEKYTTSCELVKVKSTNMGSMFRLTYELTLKDASREKEMIDRIRERNGNLEILVSRRESRTAEL